MYVSIEDLISESWNGSPLLNHLVDMAFVNSYKCEGEKKICENSRGISLSDAVGKVRSKVLKNRLLCNICPVTIPESLSGFKFGRGTTDIIFSAWQLQNCT